MRPRRSEAAGVLGELKRTSRSQAVRMPRDDEGDLGVQSLGGGERPIVLKFTGAAIDLDQHRIAPTLPPAPHQEY